MTAIFRKQDYTTHWIVPVNYLFVNYLYNRLLQSLSAQTQKNGSLFIHGAQAKVSPHVLLALGLSSVLADHWGLPHSLSCKSQESLMARE